MLSRSINGRSYAPGIVGGLLDGRVFWASVRASFALLPKPTPRRRIQSPLADPERQGGTPGVVFMFIMGGRFDSRQFDKDM